MAIVRHTAGRELTPEQHEEARQRIEAAAKRPYTYDPDCPLLTEKQLSEFRPVNFASMEERAQAMRDGVENRRFIEGSDRRFTGSPLQDQETSALPVSGK